MAKGQKRSNRELKKPKQPKANPGATVSPVPLPAPVVRERARVGGRNQAGGRDGR